MLRKLMVPIFALALAAPAIVHAQDNTERSRDRDRRDNDSGGGDRRTEWRERMATFMKERLSATDDEWKVIQPKLEKVAAARRDSGGGFGGGRGGPGGGRGGDDNETPTPSQQASRDLNTTLENKNATAEEIAAKLKALREVRAKAKETLAASQKELKEVLTQRQEAVLVEMGMLE